jgi:peptidyl-prolyl cis-trans isomerase C
MKSAHRALPFLFCLLACGNGAPPPPPSTSALAPGVAARVGTELLSTRTVTRVAERQGIAPDRAAALAVSDALWAQGARALLPAGSARSLERAAAARSMLEELSRTAAAAGPPTEAELAALLRERWPELDRPDAARTTHVVIINKQPEKDAAAHAVADKLALALRGVTSAEELLKIGQAFPGEGFEARAEPLPFVTADGRTFQRRESGFVALPGNFDPDFARAAVALQQPGQLSPVTKSSFGYHVIRLEERLPGASLSPEERASKLSPEITARRAGRARSELLLKLRQSAPLQLERAADDLTSQVKVAP